MVVQVTAVYDWQEQSVKPMGESLSGRKNQVLLGMTSELELHTEDKEGGKKSICVKVERYNSIGLVQGEINMYLCD